MGYAGLVFDLIGATYSSIAVGAPVSGWAFMILPHSLAALSYIFYHKIDYEKQKLLTTI